jgi:hypothetical protein
LRLPLPTEAFKVAPPTPRQQVRLRLRAVAADFNRAVAEATGAMQRFIDAYVAAERRSRRLHYGRWTWFWKRWYR